MFLYLDIYDVYNKLVDDCDVISNDGKFLEESVNVKLYNNDLTLKDYM
jgi:hypothetical protein